MLSALAFAGKCFFLAVLVLMCSFTFIIVFLLWLAFFIYLYQYFRDYFRRDS